MRGRADRRRRGIDRQVCSLLLRCVQRMGHRLLHLPSCSFVSFFQRPAFTDRTDEQTIPLAFLLSSCCSYSSRTRFSATLRTVCATRSRLAAVDSFKVSVSLRAHLLVCVFGSFCARSGERYWATRPFLGNGCLGVWWQDGPDYRWNVVIAGGRMLLAPEHCCRIG
ncbi:uncharacterized protein J3D65DRAFT_459171 [Phyllosticta citribraziliensis]|uniref:Uncharacterized protein n=1 Tax=Phyllosticta citribraziliensis TaxID=989973 RepID=A0ABR1LF50_9PEZI